MATPEVLSLEQLKKTSQAKVRKWQRERFAATAAHFYPRIPAYQSLRQTYGIKWSEISSPEDWHAAGLPLVKKAWFLAKPLDFVLRLKREEVFALHKDYASALGLSKVGLVVKGLTSKAELESELKARYTPHFPAFSAGTEFGQPSVTLFTPHQKNVLLPQIIDIIAGLWLPRFAPAEPLVGMNLFPYAPHLGWHAVHLALDRITDLNLSTAAGGVITTQRLLAMASRFKANVIAGMADYLRHRFLPLAIASKTKLAERVMYINGAQKMHPPERKQIRELFAKAGVNATVLDLYAASELKTALSPECEPGSGFHHIAPLSTVIKTVRVQKATADRITAWEIVQPQESY